jgi:membrane protein
MSAQTVRNLAKAAASFPGMVPRFLSAVASLMSYSVNRFWWGNCFQAAAALTYTALLALVPLLTIGFAIFAAFPAYEALQREAQTLIFNNLVPQVGDALLEALGPFMANAGQLTAFGVIGLAFTAIMLLFTIEGSFNTIFNSREPRPVVLRILAFWAILTVAPLLFGASLSLSGQIFNLITTSAFGEVTRPFWGMGKLTPGLFEFMGCTLLYVVIPNRSVHWRDAAVGGLVAAALLEISKSLFALYMSRFPVYQTIYGALSSVPIFLVWLYIAWSALLFGAVVTASLPEWRSGRLFKSGSGGLLPTQRIAVALAVLHELMQAGRLGVGLRRQTLLGRLPLGTTVIDGTLEVLADAHWVARTTRGAWIATRDFGEVTLEDLSKALSIGLRGPLRSPAGLHDLGEWQDRFHVILEDADRANRAIMGLTLKELFDGPLAATADPAPSPNLVPLPRRGRGDAPSQT